jgi:hypothetical protein
MFVTMTDNVIQLSKWRSSFQQKIQKLFLRLSHSFVNALTLGNALFTISFFLTFHFLTRWGLHYRLQENDVKKQFISRNIKTLKLDAYNGRQPQGVHVENVWHLHQLPQHGISRDKDLTRL